MAEVVEEGHTTPKEGKEDIEKDDGGTTTTKTTAPEEEVKVADSTTPRGQPSTPRGKKHRKKKKKRQAPREGEAHGAAAKEQQQTDNLNTQEHEEKKNENEDAAKNEANGNEQKNESDKNELDAMVEAGSEKEKRTTTKKSGKKAKKGEAKEGDGVTDNSDISQGQSASSQNGEKAKKKKKKKKIKSPRGEVNNGVLGLVATAPAALKLGDATTSQGTEGQAKTATDPPLSAVRQGPRSALSVSSPVLESPLSPTSGVKFAQRLSLANVLPRLNTLPFEKKPRTFNSNVYMYSFSGKTLVKWMLEAGIGVRMEPEAMILGELMLNAGVIVPLSRKVEFSPSGKDYYAVTDAYVEYARPKMAGSMIGGRVMSSDDTKKISKRSSVMLTFRSISMRGLNQLAKSSSKEKDKKEEEDSQYHIYGRSLEEVMALQMHSHPDEKVPIILKTLTKAIIDTQGHKTEGIFRVPGKNDEINRLKNQFNKLDYTITSDDPNDLGGALKLWVRELKDPLMPNSLYDDCVLVANDPAACLEIVSTRVPELNRHVIYYLLGFLQEMARHANITRMGTANLGMVFAPGLLRCDDVMKMMTNTAHEGAFVKNLIEHYKPESV